nr:MAG TPA: hypothetical protein [Caudoviricetes sp.]DAL77741.1 MAG TPA: hypothetical protein [Bacteriophage sp.]DAR41591.1 MAG TPA: hypothetical protein [Caudoviricetes sp.]DAU46764.1 MAG TPA: hypothetical protein [Caudoviricetes sp.]DAV79781.1 MAG TPA: hypothetical protein [Caudoviricetes sp.]
MISGAVFWDRCIFRKRHAFLRRRVRNPDVSL